MQRPAQSRSSWRAASRAALLSVLLLLAACGGGDAEPTGEGTAAPDTGAETATEAEAAGTEPTAGEESPAASDVLAGETINFVIPYEPGGGYDQYVRLISPFLADCLGAQVVPVNEPGAGSLLATNQTAVAEPDGTRIQILNAPGAIGAQLGGAEGANYDLRELSWISRLAAEPNVLSVGAGSEFTDFQDIIDADRPIRWVSTGPGSVEHIASVVLSDVYGMEPNIISGFAGSGEARAAIIAGDADAHVQTLDSALGAIQAGDVRPLVLLSTEGSDVVPDVPTIYDYPAPDEQGQVMVDTLVSLMDSGRPVAGPPGMSEEVLTALREGFQCALDNEEFLATAEEAERPVNPLSGEEMAQLIDNVLSAPPAFQQMVADSF